MEIINLMKELERIDFTTPFNILMLVIWVNMFLYGRDFYRLVKRKSMLETLSIMFCPVIFIATGVVMLSIMIDIPFSDQLDCLLYLFDSEALWKEIILLSLVFWPALGAAYLMRRKKRGTKKDNVTWLLSNLLDMIISIVLLGTGIYCLCAGKNPFRQTALLAESWGMAVNVLFFIFLYGIIMLLPKVIVILLSLAVGIYTGEITFFKYKEGKNPAAYLTRYLLLYQNAVVRGMLPAVLVCIAILIPLWAESWQNREQLGEAVMVSVFLSAMVVFLVALVLNKLLLPFRQMKKWGSFKGMAELFCMEYFLNEAVWSSEEYVVTRSFLVDRSRPLQIYYWEKLTGWKKNITAEECSCSLTFSDDSLCRMPYDKESSEKILHYARNYYETHHLQDSRQQEEELGVKNEGAGNQPSQKYITIFIMIMIVLLYFFNMAVK